MIVGYKNVNSNFDSANHLGADPDDFGKGRLVDDK